MGRTQNASLAVWLGIAASCATAPADDRPIEQRLVAAVPDLARPLAEADELRIQILVGVPVTRPDGCVELEQHAFGDDGRYFYPASSVKLCAALAALQTLERLRDESFGDSNTSTRYAIEPRFAGDVRRPPAGPGPSLGQAIQRLCVVSDNQAFNDLYEFVGHRELNEAMLEAGLEDIAIRHRLSEFRSVEEQRQTRAVQLYLHSSTEPSGQDSSGQGPWRAGYAPERTSDWDRPPRATRGLDIGEGRMSGGELVPGPMDFRTKNEASLRDLQAMLAAVVRPDIQTHCRGFALSEHDRQFLTEALGCLPRESADPPFDPKAYPDDYTKFLLPGVRRVLPADRIRIYAKIGRAYGFSTENSCIVDTATGRCVFVAAVIYTNADGILNGDRYEYDEVADPFFADLGEAVARVFLAP